MDVNAESNIYGKPLLNAARKGHLEIVRLLLSRGADAEDGVYPRTEEDHQELRHQCGKPGRIS